MKLTKIAIARLSEPGIYWDGEVTGLGVRVGASGTKSFILKYRIGRGRGALVRKPTLGSCSDMTPDQARQIARDWKLRARVGDDPLRAQEREMQAPTMEVLGADYMERHGSDKRSGSEDRRKIERDILPLLGRSTRVKDVTTRDIDDLRRIMKDRPYAANRVLALLSKMFGLAVRWGWIDANPVRGVPKYAEKSRDRVLTDHEIGWLWETCNEMGYPWGTLGKLLLLTGQRFSEVAGMHRREVDGEVLRLPADRTKNGKPHAVPLSTPIKDILADCPAEGYLLTTTGRVPVSNSSKAAKALQNGMTLRAGAELPHWTFHDLRRTAATGMARLGVAIPVTEAVLNHVSGSTAGIVSIYQRYDYAEEKRRALEAWGGMVLEIVDGKDTSVCGP